jgi:hypothetical protein
MSSSINTNGINTNYPVPGENNSTQGFRDNFASIKNNLNTASSEITDIQNKALLKSALDGSVLDNNMNGALISNALTRGFRATTYNLGNSLTGTVLVNLAQADVHYGTIAGNVSLQFGSWAPVNTESTVILRLSISNPAAVITFPSQVVATNNNFGGTILENYVNVADAVTVTAPAGVEQLDFKLSTLDCGTTISIEPLNRPYQATQIVTRTPSPTGFVGDRAGTIAVDSNYLYVCTGDYDAVTITSLNGISTNATGNLITFDADVGTAGVTANMPVVFDTMFINNVAVTDFGNIIAGQVYYVKTVVGSTITISATRTGGTAGSEFTLTTVTGGANTGMDASFYNGTDIWKRISLTSW